MDEDTSRKTIPTSASLSIELLTQAYDAEVKSFLAEKQVLAIILKSCVKEFRDCTTEDIAGKYIQGTPQIGAVFVDRDAAEAFGFTKNTVNTAEPFDFPEGTGSKISGDANEDKSAAEGLITYDVRFTAITPGSGKFIKVIINIEAQRKYNPGYSLVKRGIYYGARLISAQKNTEFKSDEYDKLKKVYSIWICQDVPKEREHTILSYDIRESVLFGDPENLHESPENYDLMTVMLLGIGDPSRRDTDNALGMLSAALSKRLGTKEKKQILSDSFGIKMTEHIERAVDHMCNLGYGILEDGRAEGLAEGLIKGRAEGRVEGRAEGRAEGGFIMLYDLVSKNIISLDTAAVQANQSAEAFKAGMDQYLASKV